MSQNYPPPPPPSGSPQYGPPPGGYPPQPGGPVGYGVAPTGRTSGMAIASLVCGLLLCIPVLSQLLAIILGFLGIKDANKPGVGGKGLAITGLILGVVGLLGWAGIGAFGYWGYSMARDAADSGRLLVADVQAGKFENIAQYTTLSEAEMREFAAQMEGWGDIQSWSMSGFKSEQTTGGTRVVAEGTATFSNAGTKKFNIILGDAGGTLKIIGIEFE